jgi:transcriptional regulator with XRE-family HTH domain
VDVPRAEFLATRRAKITPDQAGMPLYGGRRRVPGLRREEVAMLAGVSIDYYTRLEKGNVAGVSDEVPGAVARALQLDEAEQGPPVRPRPRRPAAPPHGAPARPGLVLTFYTAEPGSPSEDALRLLASWAATIPESDRQDTGQQTPGATGPDR